MLKNAFGLLSSLVALVVLCSSAGDAEAQCQMSLTDITDYDPPVPSLQLVVKAPKYRLVASGSTNNDYDLFLWLQRPGSFPMTVGTLTDIPNGREIELFCVPEGTYEVFGGVSCDGDLNIVSQRIPLQISNIGQPEVTIAATRLQPGVYRIDPLYTMPFGADARYVETEHYRRRSDGTYSPPSPGFWLRGEPIVLFGQPGDRVTLTLTACASNLPRSATAELIIPEPEPPLSVDVTVREGHNQRAVLGNSPETPLTVKFTATRPTFDLRTLTAVFEIVSVPLNASGHGLDATDPGQASMSYAVPVAADGTASAVLTVGDREGSYVVRVASPLSLTGTEARFTVTAVESNSVAIVKDSTSLTDAAPSYAVSATHPTMFHAIGLDAAGQKIGPMKCEWTVMVNGNPSTRGSGTIVPVAISRSATFTPNGAGKLTISANPPVSGIRTASAELFITRLYVSVGAFDPVNPLDELDLFVPGSLIDGTSVAVLQMPQRVMLHVLTGGSSRGFVTFQLDNVSAYPGIAMNWPPNNPATTPDSHST